MHFYGCINNHMCSSYRKKIKRYTLPNLMITKAFSDSVAVIIAVRAMMDVFPDPDSPWITKGTLSPLLR